MTNDAAVRVISGGALSAADPTPGMARELAVATERTWSGLVHTDAGMTSGWHHHGDHETVIYVVRGTMRLESGAGGAQAVEAGPGDFVHVPAGLVHRESNPGGERGTAVLFRAGRGPTTVNVDGPAPW